MAALGTYSLKLSLAGTDKTAEISNCRLVVGDADADFVSFADANAGGAKEWRLQGTATQDLSTGSIWSSVFTSPGTTSAAVLRPNGGTTASATQPTFTGNVTLSLPDGDFLGGEANASRTAKFTWDFDFPFSAAPVMATS
ncbi:hypothetical protein GCM10023340_38910 [Nocardioides marinquilinus]|uniref:Uncharacterized protein n=1 Tax=Nocardioides marinquilinus TaxID=1210400 RepID=A0ABP9PZT5_9ACTN